MKKNIQQTILFCFLSTTILTLWSCQKNADVTKLWEQTEFNIPFTHCNPTSDELLHIDESFLTNHQFHTFSYDKSTRTAIVVLNGGKDIGSMLFENVRCKSIDQDYNELILENGIMSPNPVRITIHGGGEGYSMELFRYVYSWQKIASFWDDDFEKHLNESTVSSGSFALGPIILLILILVGLSAFIITKRKKNHNN